MSEVAEGFHYVVEGRGEFPVDMLRKDDARPVGERDAVEIEASFDKDPGRLLDGHRMRTRQVVLSSASWHAPHTERWESWSWRVVECSARPWAISAPRPGRPRVHAKNATALDRLHASLAAHADGGGVRKTFRLSAEGAARLSTIRTRAGDASDTAVFERLLRDEADRLDR